MLQVKRTKGLGWLYPGIIKVEDCSEPETKSKGGVIIASTQDKKYDHLAYGIVQSCSDMYCDFRGQVIEPYDQAMRNGRVGIRNWPIPPDSLVLYKRAQAWTNPEDRDRCTYLSAHGIVEVWPKGHYELTAEN